ncbi:MAG TPA: 23S rRNA (pseudouridine(1915)-N(3))-methyltransferase RlmH [Bacteroidetes bacterium]|nr:23S rRNA (pseudouridine(1915)-N(3))-methyltransferase RlmH [Bacteroidota bacterium]
MKSELWYIGKTSFPFLSEGVQLYEKRLKHYLSFETILIPHIKNANKLPPRQLKEKEGEAVLDRLNKNDFLVLLDERGKQYTSVEFSKFVENKFRSGHRRLVFLIGGAYGFSKKIYNRADHQLSLSKMTFSHQMIRLFFLEQLFRAMTILRGEPYHNG